MILMKRVLIIGASGQLGRALCAALRDAHDVIEAVRRPIRADQVRIDLADPTAAVAAIRATRPEWIVLAGAFCNVEGAETQRQDCFRVNVDAPRAIAAHANDQGCVVVYYSTDHVFDGAREIYVESDPVHPLNVYAQSKVQGEAALRAILPDRHLIIRTAWLYGPDPARRNFVYRIFDELGAGRSVAVASDQWGSPTYTEDLARATRWLLERDCRGTFHATGPDYLDRASFAGQICSAFGLRSALIAPTLTTQLRQAAARPLRVHLSCRKLQTLSPGAFKGIGQGLHALRDALQGSPQRSVTTACFVEKRPCGVTRKASRGMDIGA